ncbi:MAG: hemerythrin domain-containing protein [Myxococcales bacterium]|nr:hemerythrin domain-containing protein [Myxococcales bacterium]
MKRDPRLHGLSDDHHQALVLARRVRRAVDAGEDDAALRAAVDHAWATHLAPHFDVEERLLLPALEEAGEVDLAARTRAEHATLRGHLDAGRLGPFADLLRDHVRFEERTLFPACEARLPPAVLDAVGRAAPQGARDQ